MVRSDQLITYIVLWCVGSFPPVSLCPARRVDQHGVITMMYVFVYPGGYTFFLRRPRCSTPSWTTERRALINQVVTITFAHMADPLLLQVYAKSKMRISPLR